VTEECLGLREHRRLPSADLFSPESWKVLNLLPTQFLVFSVSTLGHSKHCESSHGRRTHPYGRQVVVLIQNQRLPDEDPVEPLNDSQGCT
jgi:hypothetical protein